MSIKSILSTLELCSIAQDERFPVCDIDAVQIADLSRKIVDEHQAALRLVYATDERQTQNGFVIHAVFSVPADQGLMTLRALVSAEHPHYPSITAYVMAAHWYERLMHDQFGIVADGHPDWRRLMHHQNVPAEIYPLRKDFAWNTKMAHANEPYPMHVVEGEGVYEIPVGPIHAGIIEPGHFRFNVRGERILTLEGKLFFTHKGVEKIVEGRTPEEAMPFIERVSGDAAVAHALAFAHAIEAISGVQVPKRAQHLRVMFAELERITMHLFDIGNIGGNGTGFSFMAAQGFRLQEVVRRLAKQLTGHRLFRGAICIGGVVTDLAPKEVKTVLATLDQVEKEMKIIRQIAVESDGLMERFETTGVLELDAALAYGALGVAARASGVEIDSRLDHPTDVYGDLKTQIVGEKAGDVRARFDVRLGEFDESIRLVRACLAHLPKGEVRVPVEFRAGESYGWSESWRGEILDWVRLNTRGHIDRCVVRDPSFCNWPLFGEIGPGNIVPDFPLCNKSLNLSYSGTDL